MMRVKERTKTLYAVQWFPPGHGSHISVPEAFALSDEQCYSRGWRSGTYGLSVGLGNYKAVSPGDWILRDDEGALSVCPGDLFMSRYQPVE